VLPFLFSWIKKEGGERLHKGTEGKGKKEKKGRLFLFQNERKKGGGQGRRGKGGGLLGKKKKGRSKKGGE